MKPIHIALYLSYLAQSANKAAPLEEPVNALSWMRAIVDNVTNHLSVVAGVKRILAHKIILCKREPINEEHLLLLFKQFNAS